MEKPIIYYNNRLLDAKKGDDGTTYGIIAAAVRHPGNDNAMLCTPSLITDLAADYTKLVGMQVKMTSTEMRYNVLAQGVAPEANAKNITLLAIAWSGSLYVAVGNADGADAYILTSPDGITWTERANAKNVSLLGICWTGTQFVAVGDGDGVDSYILTSSDAITWTERAPTVAKNFYLSSVCWSGTLLVAVGAGDGVDSYILTSADGITWTERAPTVAKNISLRGVTWTGTLFVAVGDGDGADSYILTSSDGTTWTERAPTVAKNISLRSVCWSGTLLVAVGAGDGADSYILTSADGTTWTERAPTVAKNLTLQGVVWSGTIFLAVGAADGTDAYMLTSTDGTTWTERSNPQNIGLTGVVYADNSFVAVGANDGTDAYIIFSYDGITWPSRSLTLFERFQDADVDGAATIRAGLTCGQQASAHPAFYAADNFLSPVHKGTVNTAHYLRAHAPNYLEDGGFESGAFSPSWTAEATNPWVIESTTELEGSYSASWNLVATKYLRQTSTKKLKKGKTYRLVFKAGSVTANPTSGAITINLFQSTSGTALDSDASGTTPTITTTAAWFSIDFTPDFDTNDWYLNIAGDSTKANGATKITVDEFYLYDKLEISNLILGRHNLVGKGSIVVRSYKMSPLRSTVAAADYTDLDTLTVTTSDTHREALTSSYDPVVEIQIPATAAFTPQAGEIYIGDQWQLPRHIKAPFDPWRTNRDGLREVTLKSEYVAPAYRTSHLEPLFDRLRDCEAIWYKWDTDQPFLVYSPRADREAPFSPYTVSFEINLVEVL